MNDNSPLTAVLIILFLVVGGAISFNKCNVSDHKSAIKEFHAWAKELSLKYEGAACNGHDSDGDGYVSCTDMIGGEAHTVECAGAWNMQHGCRAPKPVLRTTVVNNSR